MWGAIAGAALGGLLGGSKGGSQPAGETTTKQDIPEWLKPYITGNLNMATGVRDNAVGAGNELLGASSDELYKTLTGGYLTPESNPYLADYGRMMSENIGATVDSRFSAAGRYGSGAHQGTLGKSVGDALTQLYGGAYGTERGRMASAATAAPGVVQQGVQAQFQPFASYGSLIPGLTNTTQPYFENKAGGILSGAAVGAGLGKMFG